MCVCLRECVFERECSVRVCVLVREKKGGEEKVGKCVVRGRGEGRER